VAQVRLALDIEDALGIVVGHLDAAKLCSLGHAGPSWDVGGFSL
jgi:hypothetical protein